MTAPNYFLLPEHLRQGVRRWIEEGIMPGGFLRAVIANNLSEAVLRADPESGGCLRDIVLFFTREAPDACWGSQEKMDAWQREKERQCAKSSQ